MRSVTKQAVSGLYPLDAPQETDIKLNVVCPQIFRPTGFVSQLYSGSAKRAEGSIRDACSAAATA